MVLPEPVSIITTLFAIIGFFSTVRDGIQKLHDDRNSWKKIRNKTDWYLTQWNGWQEDLATWRDRYMVWEDDDELFADLWGDKWTTITEYLCEIYKVSEDVKNEITSLIRPTDGPFKGLRFTKRKSSYILFKQKPLEANFSTLANLIGRLGDLSWTKFKSQHPNKAHIVAPTDADIHEIGNAFQLVRLANATQSVSQALYQPCLVAQKKLCMNMELNFFGEDVADSRSKAISVSAKAGEIHFTILASESPNALTRMRIKNDMTIASGNCHRSINYAFDQIFRTNINAAGAIGFETYHDGPRFLVKEVPKKQTEPFQPDSYLRFRGILYNQQPYPVPSRSTHMDLTKIKAAFELIECGLLLLRTQWLSRFCSCGLRRRGQKAEDHEYLLGATGREHDDPKDCWCESMQNANLANIPLRYLGLLLVEIALDQPINDLQPDPAPEDDFPAPFLLGFPSADSPPTAHFTLAEILEKVKRANADDNAYSGAIEFCLKSAWTSEQVEETQLRDYYWGVLAP